VPGSERHRIAGWLYLTVWAGVLTGALSGWVPAADVAGLALLAFLLVEWPNQRPYARVLFIGLVGAGVAGVFVSAHPLALFLQAWRRGATYAAFFLALGALRDAAESSALVRRCGSHMVAQPPGRRYAALTAGGHLFGIILSYGAIELLGAMVIRANARDRRSAEPAPDRARRMLLAIYRGFAVMNCWSPLNIMTAVVSTAVPAAPMRLLLPVAFVAAQVMLALGWLMDRIGAGTSADAARMLGRTGGWTVHLGLVALVLLVMALAEGVAALFHVSLVTGVTLSVPLVGLAWVGVQSARCGARRGAALVLRRMRRFVRHLPGFRAEATVLGASGFVGVALAGIMPVPMLTEILSGLPHVLVPMLVPVLLLITGQLGLNPVAVVALLGVAVPNPVALGVSPSVLALSCMLGWGIAVNMTPLSASAITTARWAGVSPWTVSTIWNGAFTMLALLVGWIAIGLAQIFWPL
jgi:hypothetical protein